MENKIKEVYEDSVKNKVKGKDLISMPFNDFVKEHLCLIKILLEGSREDLINESESQKKELCKYLKERGLDFDEAKEEFGESK
jgi:hypothetical protein